MQTNPSTRLRQSTQRIGDHLGSTSLVTDASGVVINQTQFKAWGEERYSSGAKQTNYGYTGQYSYAADPSTGSGQSFGLHFYNARWYDSSLGRFAQADTIVPGGVQGYDRYAYVGNNPVRYTDPSGHFTCSNDRNSDDYCPAQTSGGSNRPSNSNPTPVAPQYVNIWDTNTSASPQIIQFIKDKEGYIETPYDDRPDNLSISTCSVGYGHPIQNWAGACTAESLSLTFTPEQLVSFFQADLNQNEIYVRDYFQKLDNQYRPTSEGYTNGNPVPITQAQFDAIVSFTYNAGYLAMIDLLDGSIQPNHGQENGTFNTEKVQSIMNSYNSAPGHIPRREAEINLFLYGVYP